MKTTRTKKTVTKNLLDCPALHYNWGFGEGRRALERHGSAEAALAATWLGVRAMPTSEFLDTHYNHAWATGFRAGLRADATPIAADSEAFEGWS